ncbi:MAG: hypothetical protein Fur0014_09610 [Rubrivivax sp.]
MSTAPSGFGSRPAALAIAVLVVGTLLSVVTLRQERDTGRAEAASAAAVTAVRALRFEDRPDGSVAVIDHTRGVELERIHGEAGFLRGTLRALSRERLRRGLGPELPFTLRARSDGGLTLSDPATGERIDLDSFGPTNAAVFGRLLTLQERS